ncbi:MAG: hypothetical protein ACJA08_002657 [Cyclobacteriaceae bacterium]|jgi:hypothetical protein
MTKQFLRNFSILVILVLLNSCGDKYDQLTRYPELSELEQAISEGLLCEQVIITIDSVSKNSKVFSVLQILLINSDTISLSDSDEQKSSICATVSNVMVRDFLTTPFSYKYIEVKIVERKKNIFVNKSDFYSNTFEIANIAEQIGKKADNKR